MRLEENQQTHLSIYMGTLTHGASFLIICLHEWAALTPGSADTVLTLKGHVFHILVPVCTASGAGKQGQTVCCGAEGRLEHLSSACWGLGRVKDHLPFCVHQLLHLTFTYARLSQRSAHCFFLVFEKERKTYSLNSSHLSITSTRLHYQGKIPQHLRCTQVRAEYS